MALSSSLSIDAIQDMSLAECESVVANYPDDKVLAEDVLDALEDRLDELNAIKPLRSLTKKRRLAEREARLLLTLTRLKKNYFCFVNTTNTSAHVEPQTHDKANLHLAALQFDLQTCLSDLPNQFWEAHVPYNLPKTNTEFQMTCYGEHEVVAFSRALIDAVISGLGLDRQIKTCTNKIIAGQEIDIVLLYGSENIPFAAVEVKKPSEGSPWPENQNLVFNSGNVAGQNLDQLRALEIFGFDHVWGMICDGNHWLVTCTQKTEVKSLSACLDYNNDMEEAKKDKANNGKGSPESRVLRTELMQTSDLHRELFGGCVVPPLRPWVTTNPHVDMQNILALNVLFVANSLYNVLQVRDTVTSSIWCLEGRSRTARVLRVPKYSISSDGEHHFSDNPPQTAAFEAIKVPPDIRFGKYIESNVEKIYVISHLGWGANAHCCFAITHSGKACCAVKFFNQEIPASAALAERDAWEYIYGSSFKCHVGVLPNHRPYLIMPYLAPMRKDDRRRFFDDGTIRKVLETISGAGWCHNDVRWRHFGRYQKTWYMLDMGNVQKVSDARKRSDWVDRSLRELGDRLGDPMES